MFINAFLFLPALFLACTTCAHGETSATPAIARNGIVEPQRLSRLLVVDGWVQLGGDIDGEAVSDQSGRSVSVNAAGDRVAIGAPFNDNAANSAGQVRVYEYSSGSGWVQLGSDIDGEASGDTSGWSVSVNANGDRVAIGAPYSSSTGAFTGFVRVYEYSSGSGWVQLGGDIDSEAASDHSGMSVSVNAAGDRVAIGAPFNDNAGHVRVYEYSSGSGWVQLGGDIDGEASGDYFGWSVSMNANGDRVAIGAPYNDGTGDSAGHVRVYEYSSGTGWVQLGGDIDGEASRDQSGWSVSMNANGDRVAIGAHLNDVTSTPTGHVRVYEYSSGTGWVQLGGDIDGEAVNDESGRSVSVNAAGDRVAIGAPYNDGTGTNAGHVRVYEYSSGTGWVQLGSDIDGEAVGDTSGWSVSMNANGDRVAIGAGSNDGTGTNAGHVRVYEEALPVSPSNPTSQPTGCLTGEPTCQSTHFSPPSDATSFWSPTNIALVSGFGGLLVGAIVGAAVACRECVLASRNREEYTTATVIVEDDTKKDIGGDGVVSLEMIAVDGEAAV